MKRLFLILLLFSTSAIAGGHFMVDDVTRSGVPSRWPFENGKWTLRWKADFGNLTTNIDNEEAVEEWVKPLFEKWKTVTLPNPEDPSKFIRTTALEFIYDWTVNADINADNYDQFIFETIDPDLRPATIVIFDQDGSLIEKFCKDQGNSDEVC